MSNKVEASITRVLRVLDEELRGATFEEHTDIVCHLITTLLGGLLREIHPAHRLDATLVLLGKTRGLGEEMEKLKAMAEKLFEDVTVH